MFHPAVFFAKGLVKGVRSAVTFQAPRLFNTTTLAVTSTALVPTTSSKAEEFIWPPQRADIAASPELKEAHKKFLASYGLKYEMFYDPFEVHPSVFSPEEIKAISRGLAEFPNDEQRKLFLVRMSEQTALKYFADDSWAYPSRRRVFLTEQVLPEDNEIFPRAIPTINPTFQRVGEEWEQTVRPIEEVPYEADLGNKLERADPYLNFMGCFMAAFCWYQVGRFACNAVFCLGGEEPFLPMFEYRALI